MPGFLTAFGVARAHWKLLGLGLLLLALAVQTVRLGHAQNVAERAKIANNELRAELKAISDAKNKQAEDTKRNVGKAEEREKQAKPIADKIRSAPIPPGSCSTPGIDILRNEI